MKNLQRVSRVGLRQQYADKGMDGIYYDGYGAFGISAPQHRWLQRMDGMTFCFMSERQALRKLAHLPYPRKGVVPVKILPIVNGRATRRGHKNDPTAE